MIARILPLLGIISLTSTIVSCKKEESPTLQEQLNDGTSIHTLMESYPVDSFYTKSYGGGYIFHLEANGTGMVVGKTDLSSTATWGCNATAIDGADGSLIGTGKANSDSIVSQCSDPYSAAVLCENSSSEGFTDWYLPSQDELKKVYNFVHNRGVGNFESNYYWTSTETSLTTGQHVLFTNGSVSLSTKSNAHFVRAVRNF